MIIFDLDGTLADCEHRRHFVDPEKNENYCRYNGNDFRGYKNGQIQLDVKLKPDWDAFYEACDKDTPIQPLIYIWNLYEVDLALERIDLQIWSGRSQSVREKTEKWLDMYLTGFDPKQLKMRPIGDYTPDDQLKERWLDEQYEETKWGRKHHIDFVFDDRPKVIRM